MRVKRQDRAFYMAKKISIDNDSSVLAVPAQILEGKETRMFPDARSTPLALSEDATSKKIPQREIPD
jgi:hypothetical protein